MRYSKVSMLTISKNCRSSIFSSPFLWLLMVYQDLTRGYPQAALCYICVRRVLRKKKCLFLSSYQMVTDTPRV